MKNIIVFIAGNYLINIKLELTRDSLRSFVVSFVRSFVRSFVDLFVTFRFRSCAIAAFFAPYPL